MPSQLILTQSVTNGLANISDAESFKMAGNGRPEPIFDYDISDLQRSLTAYRCRRYAFRYDELKLSTLVNLSGDYDLLFIGIPVNEEDAVIAWKQTYRTQFSVPPNSILLSIEGWVEGIVDHE